MHSLFTKTLIRTNKQISCGVYTSCKHPGNSSASHEGPHSWFYPCYLHPRPGFTPSPSAHIALKLSRIIPSIYGGEMETDHPILYYFLRLILVMETLMNGFLLLRMLPHPSCQHDKSEPVAGRKKN